ncbi:metallophosphoesterase family protein [Humidesulfovibrio sp.]
MKLGVISDVHGNAPALAAVLRAMEPVDALLCLGDTVGYYPFSSCVCRTLRSRCAIVLAGNHDRYVTAPPPAPNALLRASLDMVRATLSEADRAWLAGLPETWAAEVDGVRLMAMHGSPWDALEEYVYPDHPRLDRFASLPADVVFLGHTHRPMRVNAGNVLVVNPGSVGQPRDGDPDAAWAVLDTATRILQLRRVAYNNSGVVRRLPQRYSNPDHIARLASYLSKE